MKITQAILDKLTEEAKASPRLRMNLDLRNSSEDHSQRMLNALMPGTQLPIHRHPNTSETVVILKGALKEIFYDGEGRVTDTILLSSDNGCVGVNVPRGQWHTVEVLEPTVIIEVKDGSYEPLAESDIMHV